MSIATCPPGADLERLFLGGLGEKDMEALEQHVLECASCLESLKGLFRAKDTLAGVLSDATSHDLCPSIPAVEELIKRLATLPSTPSNPLPRGHAMLTFSCSGCQKPLSIKEEMAGKKVKCPGCGQVQLAAVPVRVATVPSDAPQGTPPASDASHAPTLAPSSRLDATEGVMPPAALPDTSLTDFLSPSQAGDELGRLGKYRILKILGHGGMGVVFKAEDPKLKRSVAIKAMLPNLAANASAGKRFLREAEAMAAVEHDHVVRIYQVDEDRGVPFLAMEFLKGEPLDERLKRGEPGVSTPGSLPLAEVLRIGREIAEALSAAHATGLIHRDVKPGNIWLEAPRNRVKILDFGLARVSSQDASLTQQGAIVGTPAFMAPEQARGEAIDARCDLFSLGVVLYRLCTGRQPFVGSDSMSTLVSIAMDQPTAPVLVNFELPQELSDLVMKLLEKDPAKRIASADAVVAALQKMETKLARQREAEEKTTMLPAVQRRGTAPRRRWPTFTAAAAVVLAGLIGLGLWATGLIRFQTDDGDFVVKTDDPDFSFQVAKGGGVTLKDAKTGREYRMKVLRHDKATGEYELEVTDVGADLSFKTKKFTIKRGDKVALATWFERKKGAAVGVDAAWIKEVATLPAEKQVEAVAAKLKERNPGFDGAVTHKIEGGVVTEFAFTTDIMTDLSPIRALSELRILKCGTYGKSPLTDLSPLMGLKLTELHCNNTRVADLSPLKGMRLMVLSCRYTQVSDLSSLKDMKLTNLGIAGTPVADLSPLEGMPLSWFDCRYTQVSDLSLLKGMPLKVLSCDFKKERDAEILRSITSLESINGKPAAAFWKDVDAAPLAKAPGPWQPLLDAKLADWNPRDGNQGNAITVAEIDNEPILRLRHEPNQTGPYVGTKKYLPNHHLRLEFQFSGKGPALLYAGHTWGDGGKCVIQFQISSNGEARRAVQNVRINEAVLERGVLVSTGIQGQANIKLADAVLKPAGAWNTLDLVRIEDRMACFVNGRFLGALADLREVHDGKETAAGKTAITLLCAKDEVQFRRIAMREISALPPELSASRPFPPLDPAWLKQVAALPPERQVDAVAFMLQKGNPGFDGSVMPKIEGSVVTELEFVTDKVTDISPVRALTSLKVLHCAGSEGNSGKFADLSPLTGMSLERLTIDRTKVADLTPLKDMKLKSLWMVNTLVADLTPLMGMKEDLASLNIAFTKVTDLTPLKDMKVTYLRCEGLSLTDISPLKGTPLERFHCNFKPERDAAILRSIKTLTTINGKPAAEFWKDVDAAQKPISEAWLKEVAALPAEKQVQAVAAKLKERNPGFDGAVTPKIEDGVVTELTVTTDTITDIAPVRALTGLRSLSCGNSSPHKKDGLANLWPLKGMKLTTLNCWGANVSDLSPLKDMKLTKLVCAHSLVSDLSPVKDMPLTLLSCNHTPVTDLSPLRGLPLKTFDCDDLLATGNAEILRSIKTLTTINNKPAAEFWKDVDTAQKPIPDAWLKAVAIMKAEQQIEAVKAELVKRNPGFDSKIVSHTVEAGVVRRMGFSTANVTDISPVRALTGLQNLSLTTGSSTHPGALSDLSPLKDMKLTELNFYSTNVSDLSPLKGMPLTTLTCRGTKVADLSPLTGMQLTDLNLGYTQVSDLSPLKGMPLTALSCDSTSVSDLSVLTGMKLVKLNCRLTKVSDLTPLKGMPLKTLDCDFKPERDAAILRSIKTLTTINGKPAAEFWKDVDAAQKPIPEAWFKEVAAMPAKKQVDAVAAKLKERNPSFDGKVTHKIEGGEVTELGFLTDNVTDISPVRALTGLQTLTCSGSNPGKGKLADLSPLKGTKLTQLFCHNTLVADLAPLKDLKLTCLECNDTSVADLAPLKHMNLSALFCKHTHVSDLTPLKEMKLTGLDCRWTTVSDLSVLRGTPLKALDCDISVAIRNSATLRSLKTLATVNGKPAADFWKDVDAKKP